MYILNILSTMENDKRFEDFIFVNYYRQTGFSDCNWTRTQNHLVLK